MSEPYGPFLSASDAYSVKRPVAGRLAAVLRLRMEDRGLALIIPQSRAIRRGDIVELATTSERAAGPGGMVGSVGYLGFAEVTTAGVILCGDVCLVNGREVGSVIGFDETHMPNHMSVVLLRDGEVTGEELGLGLEDKVLFRRPKED